MSKVTLKYIQSVMDVAPSGGVVAITDYIGSDGTVKTFQGQLGCSYGDAKESAIAELKEAVENESFNPITVSGKVWANEDGSFATRKSADRTLVNFNETYTVAQVLTFAKEILNKWENPKVRKDNKIQLTDKENGLSYNQETGNFNFSLVIWNEYFKEEKTAEAKAGKPVEIKASHPDTVVKKEIRSMFEKPLKTFTLAEGKFGAISIAGEKFLSENITL